MLNKVKETIEKYRLLSERERVVVGFSGGIDSLCLLHILAGLTEYRLEIWALYINHSLRPSENILEERLLHEMGARLQVNYRQITLDLPERLRQKPQSLQLLAREERYRLFETFRREIGASKVALAHHRDDQAETVLYRIIRGTGLDGLAGIPVIRDGVYIRPLLYVSRAEIETYAAQHHLRWVEDSSNQKLIYRRNRIRNQLIPAIEKDFNPQFKTALTRLSELAAAQRDFMEDLVKEQLALIEVAEPHRTGFKLSPFLKLHPYFQYYLLTRILAGVETAYRMESEKLKCLLAKITNDADRFQPVNLYKQVRAYYENGVIFFEKMRRERIKPGVFIKAVYPVNIPGTTRIKELNLTITAELVSVPDSWEKVTPWEAYLNPDELRLPAVLRFWRPGDAFRPLGMVGTQKLHDFFINQKISRECRSKIPLLTDAGGRIVWVVGYRLGDDFKVRDPQRAVWRITIQSGNEV